MALPPCFQANHQYGPSKPGLFASEIFVDSFGLQFGRVWVKIIGLFPMELLE
jgi:hypothetical protein